MLKTETYFSIFPVLMFVVVEDQANDEIQMTNDEGMTKPELGKIASAFVI
jgi:hypothetical protein